MATTLAQIGALLTPQHTAKLQLLERGFSTAQALDATRHEHRLAEMDRALSNRLAELHAQHQLDGDKAIVDSIIQQMEGRAAARNDAFKMIMQAAIQIKVGKIEHERNLETAYQTRLYDYLFELCRQNRQQDAKDYIDQLYAEAAAGGF